jgi:uncharacterized protein (DUF2147 family)
VKPAAAIALVLVLALAPAPAFAASGSPIGRWTTIDDKTHAPRGMVEIREEAGQLVGVIIKAFPGPGEIATPSCSRCRGALKDQPIIGMRFLWGLHPSGDAWSGGRIVDPDSGNEYNAKIRLTPGGRELKVRGFLGIETLGRTQTWIRAE